MVSIPIDTRYFPAIVVEARTVCRVRLDALFGQPRSSVRVAESSTSSTGTEFKFISKACGVDHAFRSMILFSSVDIPYTVVDARFLHRMVGYPDEEHDPQIDVIGSLTKEPMMIWIWI